MAISLQIKPRDDIFLAQGKRPDLEDRCGLLKASDFWLWWIFDGHGDGGKIGDVAGPIISKEFPQLAQKHRGDMPQAFTLMMASLQEEVRKRKLAGGSTALLNYLDLKTHELFVSTLGDTETKVCTLLESKWKLLPLSTVCNWERPKMKQGP